MSNVFNLVTFKSGKNIISEVSDKVDEFGFKSLIKLDGGGSNIIKIDNELKTSTPENRRINNILVFE